jgi:thiamine pyrophosphokinase
MRDRPGSKKHLRLQDMKCPRICKAKAINDRTLLIELVFLGRKISVIIQGAISQRLDATRIALLLRQSRRYF